MNAMKTRPHARISRDGQGNDHVCVSFGRVVSDKEPLSKKESPPVRISDTLISYHMYPVLPPFCV